MKLFRNKNLGSVLIASSLVAGLLLPTTPLFAFAVDDGSIYGAVFNDVNNNAIKDDSEIGLSGWTVTLTDITDPTVQVPTTITDDTGAYGFSDLASDTYTVCETIPTATPAWTQTNNLGGNVCDGGAIGYQITVDHDTQWNKDFLVYQAPADPTPPPVDPTPTPDPTPSTDTGAGNTNTGGGGGGGNGPVAGSLGSAPQGNLNTQSFGVSTTDQTATSTATTTTTSDTTSTTPTITPPHKTSHVQVALITTHAASTTLDIASTSDASTTPTTTPSNTDQTASVIYGYNWNNWYYLFIALILAVIGGVYYESRQK